LVAAALHLWSAQSAAAAEPELERFFNSAYTYCDAQLLATHWKDSVGEAKARIGRKLAWGDVEVLTGELRVARRAAVQHGARCSFFDSAYTYDDAELLSKLWGVSVSDAKTIIEDKLLWGNDDIIKGSLVEALALQAPGKQPARDAGIPSGAQNELTRFFESEYTYCDALLISQHWGESLVEAKATIGRKLGWGDVDVLEGLLTDARASALKRRAPCTFDDTGLSFEDVQALASAWKTNTAEAKARAATLFTQGRSKDVRAALTRPVKAPKRAP
jgi:hypothetical protein